MEGALRGYVQQGAPPPTAPAAPAFADSEYVTGADLQRLAPRMIQDAMRGDLNAVVEIAASNALETVKREYAEEFRDYGPTIYANLASQSDKRLWTVDNLRKLVKYSLADHVPELARKQAARLVAEMGPTLRSSGAPLAQPSPQEQQHTLQSDALPETWKKQAQEAGLTESAIDEFLRATGTSREEYFGMVNRNQVITEAPRR